MYLPGLNESEFLRYAEQQLDTLTSSDVERELLRRYTALIDNSEAYQPFIDVLDEYGIEAHELEALLDALPSAGNTYENAAKMLGVIYQEDDITNAESLESALDLAHVANAYDIFDHVRLKDYLELLERLLNAAGQDLNTAMKLLEQLETTTQE